ncbi:PSD1 and planctomycete cytochrome C domain-containing protein [Roseimaritima ulvae]|uniref:Planctomycete cytochrome C n=1 Tax=Roseimaritima ulvae TaxID=980254 RepID=A0A5B9QT50_9BACT|nr:PSD1 and planctomycete cytochrome C domain-containing protein [Roseimaritima ulvae]QEG42188.1 Planctomycete cytochrome C [Roseimaritima ulvae]
MLKPTCYLAVLCLFSLPFSPARADDEVDFNADVRPILATHCFKCHGPDEGTREADLRVDTFAAATADRGGYAAIVPGHPADSELLQRVSSDDPDLRMPPPEESGGLTAAEVQTLTRWIESGAEYQKHWSLVPPVAPVVPARVESFSARTRSAIDRFVQTRLHDKTALHPAPPADRYTLVRRLYLDLTGLPPTPEQADAFVHDDDPMAYVRLVDRLLASPSFAENITQPWLDLARYADTNGYEKDRPRTIWPYRDWVLHALANDMPFDQFSTEQLAGDMLPGATNAQRIATGFHRNTMLNEEGGIDPLEFRFQAMVDRVATTGTVWLGLTTGCAQCHTHKYDPITHTDYYALMALLNNADEPEVVVEDPAIERRQQQIDRQIDQRESQLVEQFLPDMAAVLEAWRTRPPGDDAFVGPPTEQQTIDAAFQAWLDEQFVAAVLWQVLPPESMRSTMPRLEALPDGSILASGDVTKRDVYRVRFDLQHPTTALRLEVLPHDSLPAGGPGMAYYEGRRGDFFLSEWRVTFNGKPVPLHVASHDYGKISVGSGDPAAASVLDGDGSTGWSTSGREGQASQLVVNLVTPLSEPGELEIELLFERHFAAALGRFRVSAAQTCGPTTASPLPADVVQAIAAWDRDQQPDTIPCFEQLRRHFLRTSPLLRSRYAAVERLQKQRPKFVRSLAFQQRGADHTRPTFRHHRGEYLQPREQVQPDIPEVFGGLPPDSPRDRLALARWLVSEQNPLVGRVVVNRVWRALFGYGIVRTDGDFGTQSEPPSHPELLDHLATEWMRHDWSMKWLYRTIVLTATYQQASARSGDADPENRWLARGARVRLPAETIRDQFLAASTRLTRTFGGPSVRPPQLAAVTQIAYGNPGWPTSSGGDRYRRSLYTFQKRTAPFAALTVFDAPSREACIARRQRSDTPLQALTLLNDEMFIELARHLAERTYRDDLPPAAIANQLFRTILIRPPTPDEQASLLEFYEQQREQGLAPQQAFFLLTRALMNTDEAITRP